MNKKEKECKHQFVKYPPKIGKLKVCTKCGFLWVLGDVKFGEHTIKLSGSGNYIETSTTTAPTNPISGKIRLYATSGTSLRMRDSTGTETDLAAATPVQYLAGRSTTLSCTTTKRYNTVMGLSVSSTTEISAQSLVRVAGTVTRIMVHVTTAPSGGTTVTLRKNGVDTAITVNVPGTAGWFEATGSVTVVSGDLLSISTVQYSGTAGDGTADQWGVVIG